MPGYHYFQSEIYLVLILLLRFCFFTTGQLQFLDSGEETPRCDIDCSSAVRVVLCGTDGRTYESECEISKANCEGHPVKLKQIGDCPESSRCFMERAHAQEIARRPAAGIFIPECNQDGSYVDVQCHTGTGYCWCVNKQGKPVPSSSARYKRPNCPAYLNSNSHKRTSRGRKTRRTCSIDDRNIFNRNMINIFGSEYNRTTESQNTSYTEQLAARAVNWKYRQLDLNNNEQLNKSELRDLRRMVKKIIRPRPCARTFTQYCDLDQDKNITREEWAVCLGLTQTGYPSNRTSFSEDRVSTSTGQTSKEKPGIISLKNNSDGAPKTLTSPPPRLTTLPYLGLIRMPSSRLPKGSRLPFGWRSHFEDFERDSGGVGFLQEVVPTNSSAKRRDPSKRKRANCSGERTKALAKQRKDPSAGIYVPSCVGNNYADVQCHPATGFCWCVNPENGKPIPQTSTHNTQPNCNLVTFRPLRGCPGTRKERFLSNLTATFANEMENASRTNRSVSQYGPSRDEIFRWKFRSLDTNGNGILERGEWRPFKQYLASQEALNKCGKGYFKFCDTDDNKRVTTMEWLQCATIPTETKEKRIIPVNGRRKGPNPLNIYLKAD